MSIKKDKRNTDELKAVAQGAIRIATKAGASQVSARAGMRRFFRVSFKGGEIETLQESSDRSLGIRLFVDGRYSNASTSDLRPGPLESFIQKALEATRLLDPDPDRMLPDKEAMNKPPSVRLDRFDPAVALGDKEQKVDLARRAEAATRKAHQAVFHAESEFHEEEREGVLVTSEGFMGDSRSTSAYVVAQAYVQEDEHKRRSEYSYWQGTHLDGLGDPEEIGLDAAQRALKIIGSAPVPTGTYDLVLENRAAGWLVNNILGPLSGQSLYRKQSFLDGKQGQVVAAPALTIIDDPLMPRGLASRLFDGEGIWSLVRPVIKAGVLHHYYLNTYYARKLSMAPTTGGSSNLIVPPGVRSPEEMISDVQRGLLVTQFLGGNSNGLTGDFSAGVSGFLIEDGRVGRPVAEVNIGGRLQSILMGIVELANDPFPYSRVRIPTIRIANVPVGGV